MSSSVILTVPQLVDLALGTPEVGTVNFNVLQTLLQVLIQQMDMQDTKVEFRGAESERLTTMLAHEPLGRINLTEYVVTPGKDQGKKIKKRRKRRDSDSKKRSKEDVGKLEEETVELDSKGSFDTVILVESAGQLPIPHASVAVSMVEYKSLLDEINYLKEQIRELVDLPGNMGLLDAIKASKVDKSAPILDMFQILNLVKRLDATETGMTKMASIIEDVVREIELSGVNIDSEALKAKVSIIKVEHDVEHKKQSQTHIKDALTSLDQRIQTLEESAGLQPGVMPEIKQSLIGAQSGGGAATYEALSKEIYQIKKEIKVLMDMMKNINPDEMAKSMKDFENIAKMTTGGKSPAAYTSGESDGAEDVVRLNSLESKFFDYMQQMQSMENMYSNEINQLRNQFTDLEKVFNAILERINVAIPGGPDGDQQEVDTAELYNKTMALQANMENLSEIANKLMQDKDEKQKDIEAFMEQIEFLKTVKADREDLEDALADKADACAVTRKVSHDQFDAACDDLSRGIEEALEKLTQQENLWQQALDDIQREIGNKLDRMELGPLRDFVNHKLKMLQERLKALTALRKEQEAAGTKQKLLRDVNCISCDKEVIMRKQVDPSTMPKPYAMPPTRSMGPYLAYELDALRKQQKCLPTSKNLHHFESALQGKGESAKDHICNRYCGGSHTVTTAQQRVTRLGHFLTQWGADTVKCVEGQMLGTDGQMYKSDQEEREQVHQVRPSILVKSGIAEEKKSKDEQGGGETQTDRKSSASAGPKEKAGTKKDEEKRGSIDSKKSAQSGKPATQPESARRGSAEGSRKGSVEGTPRRGSQTSKRSSISNNKKTVKQNENAPEGEASSEVPPTITEETASEVGKVDAAGNEASAEEGTTGDAPAGDAEESTSPE